jgi:TonB family protein
MKQKIFEDLITKKRFTASLVFFPLALILHGILIGSIIVFPLLSASLSAPILKFNPVLLKSSPVFQVSIPVSRGESGKGKGGNNLPPKKTPEQVMTKTGLFTPNVVKEIHIDDGLTDFLNNIGQQGSDNGLGIIGGIPLEGIPTEFHNLLDQATSPLDNEKPFQVNAFKAPKLVKRVAPVYSKIAKTIRAQGKVVIEAVTDAYGRVVHVTVISSAHPVLNALAIQSVKQWIYEPYLINGIPKPVSFTVTVEFKLQ